MKIGVLTLPLHTNYGGILQAYALQQVLKRMGHEAVLLDRRRFTEPVWYLRPLVYGKRIFCKFVLKKKLSVFYERDKTREIENKQQNTIEFIKKHIDRQRFKKYEEIKEGTYDCLIVGSDQVWRQRYADSMLGGVEHAYLDFAETWKTKRIAYSASFGTEEWEYDDAETARCRELAKLFSLISVREESGRQLCHQHFGINAQLVADPTLLLTENDYVRLLDNKTERNAEEGKIMVYMLDRTEEKKQFVDAWSKRLNLDTFIANSDVDNRKLPKEKRVQPPVEEWLRGFKDAKYVITDSFHACVFSIIFQKQFIVLGNEERGMARFESLLKQFGLEDRLVRNTGRLSDFPDIDYTTVTPKVEQLRQQSIDILKKSLN